MTPQFARVLVRLYPRRWRDVHAAEFTALLEDTPLTPFAVADVIRHGFLEQLRVRANLARVVGALLAFGLCEAIAVRYGITDNILWAPTTPLRATALAITLAPLVSVAGFYASRLRAKVGRYG
jgi:hypothetical protein